jgi:hypothetical protein
MADEEKSPGPKKTTGSDLGAAADRLREAARWLVVTFGAVAAVAFAGISASRVDSIDLDTGRAEFWWATGSLAAAVLGIVAALLIAMSLAAASTVTVADLVGSRKRRQVGLNAARDSLARDPVLAPWGHKTATLVTALEAARADFHDQLTAWHDNDDIESSAEFVNRASTRIDALEQELDAVLKGASYVRLQKCFRVARWTLAVSLALAAAGATGFVLATGPESGEDIPAKIEAATWQVPKEQFAALQQAWGGACAYQAAAVPVLVLGSDDDGKERDVATAPATDCRSVRLTVDKHALTLTP